MQQKVRNICLICGEDFFVSKRKSATAKYCSKQCRLRATTMILNKVNHQNSLKGKTKKNCENVFCKKEFWVPFWKIKQKYCCNECRKYAFSVQYKENIKKEQEKANMITKNKIWGL